MPNIIIVYQINVIQCNFIYNYCVYLWVIKFLGKRLVGLTLGETVNLFVLEPEQMPVLAHGNIIGAQLLVELCTRVPVQAVQLQAGGPLFTRQLGDLLNNHLADTLESVERLNV